MEPHPQSVDDDLNEAAEKVKEKMRLELDSSSAAAEGGGDDFENAVKNSRTALRPGAIVSVKSNRSTADKKKQKKDKKKRSSKQHDGGGHILKPHKKRKL
ncbi:hypothetical protein M569_10335 [Genlisea aurea]|uniref:Uncharacterized protein n=1 Tax=Genlisea aurea TaxID=192259 RepID=S8DN70_9LAMI|nr:hypothetical protein M569_10335 [Genlisea aurea]